MCAEGDIIIVLRHDEINRLTREVTCDFMNQYYYDDGGNRTKLIHMNAVYSRDGNGRIDSMTAKASVSDQGLTKTYYYANFTELTKMTASEYGGTTRDYTYEHDNAGRLTRQVQNVFSPNSTTTYNYEWDALDRMTKVQKVASGVTKTINYTYNAAGLRVRRVDTSTNVTKLWTYQGNNIASVQESYNGSYGANDYVYTVGPGMINNVTERHLLTDTGADSWYYQYDHRGNVVAVTDYSGKILRGYQYDAFGNIPFSFATGQSGAAPTDDILFTGKDLDPDTGLYYFNARWYDPDSGRYVSRTDFDPDWEHLYVLCEQNPVYWVDMNGREKDHPDWWNPFDWVKYGLVMPAADWMGLTGAADKCAAALNTSCNITYDASGFPAGCGGVDASEAKSTIGDLGTETTIQLALVIGAYAPGTKVSDILAGRKGSIRQARLPKGSPSWAEISGMTWAEIVEGARRNLPGYKKIAKLLKDGRFAK